MRTSFMVWPEAMKPRTYDNLGDIKKDFSREELEGATFQVLYGCVVVGILTTISVLEEVFA